MGLMKSIGLLVVAGAIYAGGVVTADKARDVAFQVAHPRAQIEQGYCSDFNRWHRQTALNDDGNIEAYLVHENGRELPCLEGAVSLQVGTPEYIVDNLKPEDKARVALEFHEGLPEEKKREMAKSVVDDYLSYKREILEQGWNNLVNKIFGGKNGS